MPELLLELTSFAPGAYTPSAGLRFWIAVEVSTTRGRPLSTKDGVLGLLVERRDYGYSIGKRFKERLRCERDIYKALDTLEADGLIEGVGEKRAGRTRRGSPRVLYSPTPAGFDTYAKWLANPWLADDDFAGYEEIRQRVLLAREGQDFPILQQVIKQEIQRCVARLRQAARLLDATDDRLPWRETARLLDGDADALHLEAYVEWLRTAHAVIRHQLEAREG